MSDIFISYSQRDRARATVLATKLSATGWSVWWDSHVRPGVVFAQTISTELASAKCVIVLWSPTSIHSNWVLDEASEGLRRKILVPVLIEDVEPPLGFRSLQAARLADWTFDDDHPEYHKLLAAIEGVTETGRITADEGLRDRPTRRMGATKAIIAAGLVLAVVGVAVSIYPRDLRLQVASTDPSAPASTQQSDGNVALQAAPPLATEKTAPVDPTALRSMSGGESTRGETASATRTVASDVATRSGNEASELGASAMYRIVGGATTSIVQSTRSSLGPVLAVSPSGRFVAITGQYKAAWHGPTESEGRIEIREVRTGALQRVLQEKSDTSCESVAFSPRDDFLVSGCTVRDEGPRAILRLWELSTGRVHAVSQRFYGDVQFLTWWSEAEIFAYVRALGGDRGVRVDTAGRVVQELELPRFSYAFAPNGKFAAANRSIGPGGAPVVVVAIPLGTELRTVERVGTAYAVSGDGRFVAVEKNNGFLAVIDLRSGDTQAMLDTKSFSVRSIDFSPDGHLIAVVSYYGPQSEPLDAMQVWDPTSGTLKDTIAGAGEFISVSFSANGAVMAAYEEGGGIKVWERRSLP